MSLPNKTESKKTKKILIIVLSVLLAIVLISATVLFALYLKGKNSLNKTEEIDIIPPEDVSDAETIDDGSTVTYKGEKYVFNENCFSLLLMGVDKYSFDDNEGIGYNGQADAVYLAVLDTESSSVSLLSVSRDSMVDINTYSHQGGYMGTEKMQLCLAYAYGDGKELSCENVSRSVSRLLCNIPINSYIALDFEAIPVINDSVGGVTVPEYTDDGLTPTGKTVTLNGQQAVRYLRWRWLPELTSNNSRIERQKNFMSAFAKSAVEKTRSDMTFPLRLFNDIQNYTVTDLTPSQITYLAANYLTGVENMTMLSLEGTIEKVDAHAQFTPDSTALFETVLKLFYKKADN